MQYTPLGNTGLGVSRLAFGAMTFTAAVYPNWFTERIAVDQTLVGAIRGNGN